MYGIIYKSYNFIPAIPKTAFHHLLGHFPSTKCAAHFVMFCDVCQALGFITDVPRIDEKSFRQQRR